MALSVEKGKTKTLLILSKWDENFSFTLFPASWFDPVWLFHDEKDGDYIYPDLKKFDQFFQETDQIVTLDTFFKGAFGYHWHNRWDMDIHPQSYFGQLRFEIERRYSSLTS